MKLFFCREHSVELINTNKNKFINRHTNIYCTAIFSYYQCHNLNLQFVFSHIYFSLIQERIGKLCILFVNFHLLNCIISLDTQDIEVCSFSKEDKRHHDEKLQIQ